MAYHTVNDASFHGASFPGLSTSAHAAESQRIGEDENADQQSGRFELASARACIGPKLTKGQVQLLLSMRKSEIRDPKHACCAITTVGLESHECFSRNHNQLVFKICVLHAANTRQVFQSFDSTCASPGGMASTSGLLTPRLHATRTISALSNHVSKPGGRILDSPFASASGQSMEKTGSPPMERPMPFRSVSSRNVAIRSVSPSARFFCLKFFRGSSML